MNDCVNKSYVNWILESCHVVGKLNFFFLSYLCSARKKRKTTISLFLAHLRLPALLNVISFLRSIESWRNTAKSWKHKYKTDDNAATLEWCNRCANSIKLLKFLKYAEILCYFLLFTGQPHCCTHCCLHFNKYGFHNCLPTNGMSYTNQRWSTVVPERNRKTIHEKATCKLSNILI